MRDVSVEMGPSDPSTFLCLTCQVVTGGNQTPQLSPPSLDVRRALWPYALAAGAVVAGMTAAYFWKQHADARDRFESEYPIAPSQSERLTIRSELPVWAKGKDKLVATLKAFDPAQVRLAASDAKCPIGQSAVSEGEIESRNLDQDVAPDSMAEVIAAVRDPDGDLVARLHVGPELGATAKGRLDTMIAAARRGRFKSHEGRLAIVDALDNDALIVVDFRIDNAPKIDRDHGAPSFMGGYRTGYAFAFDRATGALRCAGKLEAHSSQSVAVLENPLGLGNEHESIMRDFEAQTDRAIAASLRVVAAAGEQGAKPLPLLVGDESDRITPEEIAAKQAACKDDDAAACTVLAVAMRRGDLPDDPPKRIALLQKGCDGHDMLGCTLLGNAYLMGRGVEANADKGLGLLESACTAEEWSACQMLGAAYATGQVQADGIKPDRAKAAGYYGRACEHGLASSCEYLESLGKANTP
jgi:hypothetical protein